MKKLEDSLERGASSARLRLKNTSLDFSNIIPLSARTMDANVHRSILYIYIHIYVEYNIIYIIIIKYIIISYKLNRQKYSFSTVWQLNKIAKSRVNSP